MYIDKKYHHHHHQPTKSVLFWENIFSQHYKDEFEYIEWYEDGHTKDVVDKIDCDVVLVNGLREYQLKDQNKKFTPITINLNITVFNRYSNGNYTYDAFGIGIIWADMACLIHAKTLLEVWSENREHWKKYKHGLGDDEFLAVPYKEFEDKFNINTLRSYKIDKGD